MERVTVLENNVEVVIKNAGTAEVPAGAGFWVDAYINPNPEHLPRQTNDIWQDFTQEGIAWGLVDLSGPIDPGGTITLAVGSQYFVPEESNLGDGWSADTTIYVQVDSAHVETSYGGVLESHEIIDGPYGEGQTANNFWPPHPTVVTAASGVSTAFGEIVSIEPGRLPPRR